jgi:hypothetical protein
LYRFFAPTRFAITISADGIYKSETIIFLYLVLLLFVSRNGGNLFDVIKGRKTRSCGKRKKLNDNDENSHVLTNGAKYKVD